MVMNIIEKIRAIFATPSDRCKHCGERLPIHPYGGPGGWCEDCEPL